MSFAAFVPGAVMLQIQLVKYAAIAAIGIVVGAIAQGWRLNSQLAQAQAEHSSQIAQIVQTATAAATDALNKQRQAMADLSVIDTKYTQDLADARSETEQLRAAVDSNRSELRVSASCPDTSSRGVRSTTTAPGVDDGATARLTDTAERDYWRLRDRISQITLQVKGLQEYIASACK